MEEAGDEGGELSINHNGTQMTHKEQKTNNQKETIKKHLIENKILTLHSKMIERKRKD